MEVTELSTTLHGMLREEMDLNQQKVQEIYRLMGRDVAYRTAFNDLVKNIEEASWSTSTSISVRKALAYITSEECRSNFVGGFDTVMLPDPLQNCIFEGFDSAVAEICCRLDKNV